MSALPGARAVTCPSCGGAIPLERLEPNAACPYCAHRWQLSAEDVRELEQYREHVQGQLARANQAYGQAAQWDFWYGSRDARRKQSPWFGLILFLIIAVAMTGISATVPFLGLPNQVLNVVMPASIYAVFFGVIGGYLFWFYRGRSRAQKSANLNLAAVHCPSCGAPHVLAPGELVTHCRHCGAALLPDQAAIAQVRARADDVALRAEIEAQRAQRRGMLTLSRSSASNIAPYIIVGSFLPITVFAACAFTFSFLFSDKDDTPLGGLFIIWALALTNIGIIALIYTFRKRRNDRWRGKISVLAQRLGASALGGIDGASAWLDRHWAGVVPLADMFPGPCFFALSGVTEGYPFQIVANAVGAHESYPGYLVVRIGAWLTEPAGIQSNEAYRAAHRSFETQGFRLNFERAGLIARADETATKRWAKRGDPVALAGALSLLGRAARQNEATPVIVD